MKDLKYYEANYRAFLPENRDVKILDFGCGSGNTLQFLKSVGYSNLYGADIYIADTWNELKAAGIQLEKFENTVQYLQSIAGKFDFIVVKDVIYYFKREEVVAITELLKQALKPGGKILFDIINGSVLTGSFTKHKDIDIKLVLTEHSMVTLIDRAGMTLEYMNGNRISVTGVRSMFYLILNSIQKLRLRLLYFSERGLDDQNPKFFSKKIIAIASIR